MSASGVLFDTVSPDGTLSAHFSHAGLLTLKDGESGRVLHTAELGPEVARSAKGIGFSKSKYELIIESASGQTAFDLEKKRLVSDFSSDQLASLRGQIPQSPAPGEANTMKSILQGFNSAIAKLTQGYPSQTLSASETAILPNEAAGASLLQK
eukprot:1380178-Amorphochlora_amoeboformis.AAC.1